MSTMANFNEDGYTIFRNVLSKEERDKYINEIDNIFESKKDQKNQSSNGVVNNEALWDVIQNENILSKIKETLGEGFRFLQHNDIHRNFSSSGWHRDCADRIYGIGSDWNVKEPYKIVRVGIYLQEGKKSRFRMGLVEGSHEKEVYAVDKTNLITKIATELEKLVFNISKRHYFPFFGKCNYHILEKGDMIVFDPRLVHRGIQVSEPKYSMFVAYGINNEHFKRHTKYYLEERKDLSYSKMHKNLERKLSDKGLLPETN